MELTLETLQHITTGAVSVTREDGWFCFHRFAQAPEVYFDDAGFQAKVTATASVTLDFITDARQLKFQYRANRASSRSLFFFDLYVNGAMVTSHGTADAGETTSGSFFWELPAGDNRVTLYFPNLYAMALKDVVLDGAAFLRPAEYSRAMVCYGDSITQGYDARHPSLTYANRFAAALDARLINKGIGGDTFHPELIEETEGDTPDIVSVAYGTNDWAHSSRETFLSKAEEFLSKISTAYPNAEKFVITPIWRSDSSMHTECGAFCEIAPALQSVCQTLGGFHVIDGASLTPHMPELLADARVHPNDLGHSVYGANLSAQVFRILLAEANQQREVRNEIQCRP